MNFLSGRGAKEPTVYGWNTEVSAPFKNLHNSFNMTTFVMIGSWKLKQNILVFFPDNHIV